MVRGLLITHHMKRQALATIISLAVGSVVLAFAGCAGTPKSQSERASLQRDAEATLAVMTARSPSLEALVTGSPAYVVFPRIGKRGAIVGGAYGIGVVYEYGRPSGFVELTQASLGAQLGGQIFSEVIVFQTVADLQRLKIGRFNLGASVSAVILQAGAGRAVHFRDGVAVAILPRGGLMVDFSVSGQQLSYKRG